MQAIGIKATVLAQSQVEALLASSVAGITATISITVAGGGFYRYELWLSDSATDPKESLPPVDGDQLRWIGVTAADGTATVTFRNTETLRDFFPWCVLQKVNVGEAINVGV